MGLRDSRLPRDRTSFVDRFETVIARIGSGVRTKGSRGVLQRIVKSMKANALLLEEWSIPHDINESLEIKPKAKPVAATVADAISAVAALIPAVLPVPVAR